MTVRKKFHARNFPIPKRFTIGQLAEITVGQQRGTMCGDSVPTNRVSPLVPSLFARYFSLNNTGTIIFYLHVWKYEKESNSF